ncbi:MAG: aminotransferase class I/II-fold pyridoxal phosphate-dependent enzyme [Anaerovoracaceae bacterium]
MQNKKENSIVNFLLSHKNCNPVSFHMPGHKGSRLYKRFGYEEFLESIADCDITEICGADNLFQPEDIIAGTMERYRRLYDVRKTYLLVNGSSCGLISAMMASVHPGGKIIMARNCHKSIFNGLTLGNISPVYIYPQLIEEFGISGGIMPEDVAKALEEEPDAEAVILPSPNYYGVCSDIEKIAEIVHSHGKILIVDQAHGAHLKFFGEFLGRDASGLPRPAEECGADIVINSTHKTLASFTQSAVMNVTSEKIDLRFLEDKLQALESTSPSYLLMASMDISLQLLEKHGKLLMREWHDNLKAFYKRSESIKGLKILNTGMDMDWTKINLDMSRCGLSGHELENLLLEKNIFVELVTGNIVMCMTGIGNTKEDFDRLADALEEISLNYMKASGESCSGAAETESGERLAKLSEIAAKKPVLHSVPVKKEYVHINEAAGRICAASIIPYPPGIPLICPGEEIDADTAEYALSLKQSGEKVMGLTEDFQVLVGTVND